MHQSGGAILFLVAMGVRLGAAELTLDGRTFTFPDEYTLETAAAPPLLERPMEADFDAQGRLYVTESSGSNEPVEEQHKKKPHRVLRLTDTDGDGIFDQRTVFADGMMFPEGCLWHEGSVYVAAPPHIWKLTDADDDGAAERREIWFDGKTLTGCANDLHGPYLGPDGMMYWCKGAFAEQTYDLPGQPGWKTTAAHVFRAKAGPQGPEGIEPVFTAGMDNPVGLAWTPEGDLIVSGTFFQHPGGGRRDGLIHAVRGGVWGKDHEVLTGHPRTGALMPPMTHLGPAAPCGMIRYGRDLLVCQFNLRKVSRHVLHPEGASYRTEDHDFLVCDHPDFHPTDVLQAPDGSVLIIDTGGWYKMCCPTSQLAKPHVPGAIYRLRRKSGEVPVLTPPPARPPMAGADLSLLTKSLMGPDLHLRREAAALLGQARLAAAVPALLDALADPKVDRFLFHALTYALLETGDAAQTRAGLIHAHPAVQAGALYALEQMKEGNLRADDLVVRLERPEAQVSEAVLFVLARHPDWAEAMVPWARKQLRATAPDAKLGRVLQALRTSPMIHDLPAWELNMPHPVEKQAWLLQTMVDLKAPPFPESWKPPLAMLLAEAPPRLMPLLFELAGQMPAEERSPFTKNIAALATSRDLSLALRLQALGLLAGPELDDAQFTLLKEGLTNTDSRPAALALLASRRFPAAQLRQLAGAFAGLGVLERPLLLKAFRGQSDEAGGLALVAAMDQSGAIPSLPPDLLQETFDNYPAAVQQALAHARGKHLAPDQAGRLDRLEKELPPGDIERGLVVFQSAKATCATCHPIGYKGGQLGPDLSKAGAVRTRRDLLEAIVFPHASFVRSYEPVQVTRQDDSVVYGMVSNQGPDAITLTTGVSSPEVRVPRAAIKSMTAGLYSLMPQGLDLILSPQELADIVAYLQSRR